ncbi:Phosphoserine phosphatase RsbP [Fundidesulfovibrio magnetotacticus]|uniref:Phosphoserine phosphatase RsbP n=1 Tax=Fundidesulfovibrio magnetotacticus TaxID=2730080 RepID=A0A6V8LSN6_9BACT|nr:fused response regulator/phosphatase [Fundidesulfovibrio magnetotacticus]GFK93099.1 Phosphoserine phosphatase RsbP [Fundidesulfovibrio magnetotacticus]
MTAQSPPADAPVRVLCVDDQPMVAEALRRMVAPEADIAFLSTQDPAKALPMALEHRPTVVLLDLVMPDIDGLTLVKYFRAHPKLKELPLVVLSTKEEPETKAMAFALGANDYLVKLPDRVELTARLRHHSQGYTRLLERDRAYRELARQLDQAASYVRNLLPAPLTDGPVRADWLFQPSAMLGGDALGYHWIDPERFAFYLLDVCDHGVGPALLSVSALNVLRSQTLPGVDFGSPAQVLAGLNQVFQMSKQNDLYFTIFYGVYRPGDGQLRYASAGHPPPLLFREGRTEELRCQSLFIGAMPEARFREAETRLEGRARLLVFSDGVYEIRLPHGAVASYEDFKAYAEAAPGGLGPDPEAALAHARALSGRQTLDDDVTMLRLELG